MNFEVLNAGRLHAREGTERLFDPLRRGDDATGTHHPDSLGLGLFIAREIARAHGGEITVHKHPAATVFAVSLPRVGAAT